MASPFPGMEPYLEQSAFWAPFHNRLMLGLANRIAPILRPQYYVEVETRTYMDTPEGELLISIPDAVILRDSLPEFLLPLKGEREAIAVDLQSIFQEVCEQASYDLRIDYTQQVPAPTLSKEDQAWAVSLINSRG